MTRHAAVSSVNCGFKVQPRALKKTIDLLRSFTGRLTKIWVLMITPFARCRVRWVVHGRFELSYPEDALTGCLPTPPR
jgi:hypothetical protein